MLGDQPPDLYSAAMSAGSGSRGWFTALAIIKANSDDMARQMAQDESSPIACPNDGEPLSRGPRGELYCRVDGWQPGQ